MRTNASRPENHRWHARSVLECGDMAPLSLAPGLTKRPLPWRLGLRAHLAVAPPVCLLLLTLCLPASAQYAIDWFTIDGGGGTSTGGAYMISGTIGQPDAGVMSGGNYTLQGGFWSIIAAAQTEGAPLLSILRTTTNTVAVHWPSPSTGWTLQQNTNSITSVNWSNVTATVQDDGTTKKLIVSPPTGNRFYRLFKP